MDRDEDDSLTPAPLLHTKVRFNVIVYFRMGVGVRENGCRRERVKTVAFNVTKMCVRA